MTEKKIKSLLNEFKTSLEKRIPKNKKNIESIYYSLLLIYDDLLFYEGKRLKKYVKSEFDLDSVIKLIETGTYYIKRNDFAHLQRALIYINDTLIDVKTHVQTLKEQLRNLISNIDKYCDKKN